jgi:hypothetical protein
LKFHPCKKYEKKLKTWLTLATTLIGLIGFASALISAWRVQAQELREVFDQPLFGTFYLLSLELNGGHSPPYPFDPYEGSIPFYQIKGFPDNYLVADTPETYQALRAKKMAEVYGGMSMMSDGIEGSSLRYNSLAYGSNDLWLKVISVTNGVGNFTIHTPNVAAYDSFGTTNLSALSMPALSLTNWVWLQRADAGQTNIVITNLCPGMGFFILGTMQDTDNDGLTDAYENLVSHTSPNNRDTDGDGLSDGWELAHGMDPLVDESVLSSKKVNYQYDASGWLQSVSGIWGESLSLDSEGNVLQLP